MELCPIRAITGFPSPQHRLINVVHTQPRYSPLLKRNRLNSVLRCYDSSSPRSMTSDETSFKSPSYVNDDADRTITVEEVRPVENNEEYSVPTQSDEKPQEDSLVDNPMKVLEFLENLNLDSEDKYSLFAFGGGAIVAIWLASAVIGAIDSIPVFPKVLELVGLGYTVWFSIRYLIFKENRAELVAKIEEIKEQVLGPKDD